MEDEYVEILGLKFNNLTYKEFLKELYRQIQYKNKKLVVTANPEIVMYARKDNQYFNLLQNADYIAPDGIGIVSAANFLNTPLKQRVPGFELTLGLLEIANRLKKRVYFIGGKEWIVENTVEKVSNQWPDIEIAGYHHGYFDHNDPAYIDMVKETNPDIVLVALGFPNQEKWGTSYLNETSHGIVMGVGGSFDVLSGNIKRAPNLVQKLNIEWLYRVVQNPKRYKRLCTIPRFMKTIIHEKYSIQNSEK